MMTDNRPSLSIMFGIFVGEINSRTVQNTARALAAANASGIEHLELMFHATGGSLSEAFALHNLFSAFATELTIYNTGSLGLTGTLAYLGAHRRKVSRHAGFTIHRAPCCITAHNIDAARAAIERAKADDDRVTALLHEYVHVSSEKWAQFADGELTFNAYQAIDVGITHEVLEFAPPIGAPLVEFY